MRQMWIIFLLMTNLTSLVCQLEDSFNSPDLREIWQGDRSLYVINEDQQLQLDADDAGQASLYAPFIPPEVLSWELFVQLDFNPSNSNRLEIVLYARDSLLETSDALLLRIGETGSDDAIQLISQIDESRTVLAEGSIGLVALDPVMLRLKIILDADRLIIEADDLGGVCFLPEISLSLEDNLLPGGDVPVYFGWICRYTSTRSKAFFFDDIYVGIPRIDEVAPSISQVTASPSSVELIFTEVIDTNSLSSASITLDPEVEILENSLSKDLLTIDLAQPLESTIDYNLRILGIRDLSGNSIDTSLIIHVAEPPVLGDLILNEILFNPEGSGSDYVEIFNRSNKRLDLKDVILANRDNGQTVSLSTLDPLSPQSFVLLTEDVNQVVEAYTSNDANAMTMTDLPAFNNDDGNVSMMIGDVTLDSYNYDEDHHNPLLDDVDGVSLERISLDAPNDSANWTSALGSQGFGTPGIANSISGTVSSDIDISIEVKIFSPNQDGFKDQAIIRYELDQSDYFTTIKIFNERGIELHTLLSSEPTPPSGSWSWDGTIDGSLAPSGIYIWDISLFALDGTTHRFRKTVGLSDFIN